MPRTPRPNVIYDPFRCLSLGLISKILSLGTKIKLVLFGGLLAYSYLCSVRTLVLTTPLSAGSKTLSPLLHLKVTFGWLFSFHIAF